MSGNFYKNLSQNKIVKNNYHRGISTYFSRHMETDDVVKLYSSVKISKIEQRGSKWVVLDSSGSEVLGEHDTKEDAVEQLQAIEANK